MIPFIQKRVMMNVIRCGGFMVSVGVVECEESTVVSAELPGSVEDVEVM